MERRYTSISRKTKETDIDLEFLPMEKVSDRNRN